MSFLWENTSFCTVLISLVPLLTYRTLKVLNCVCSDSEEAKIHFEQITLARKHSFLMGYWVSLLSHAHSFIRSDLSLLHLNVSCVIGDYNFPVLLFPHSTFSPFFLLFSLTKMCFYCIILLWNTSFQARNKFHGNVIILILSIHTSELLFFNHLNSVYHILASLFLYSLTQDT